VAFEYAIIHGPIPVGDRYEVYGTFTNGSGDTGGDVKTGLRVVEWFDIQEKGAAVVANRSTVDEDFPLVGGDVTIVTDDNVDGYWKARGY